MLSAAPRALVTSSGWPPGMTPRPIPLVSAGIASVSTRRSAATSAPSAQTSVPRISTGRAASASSPAIRVDGVGVGVRASRAGPARRRAGRRVEELVHRHVDEDRTAVRRPGDGEGVVHAAEHVRGGRQRGRVLGHARDDRRLVELLEAAAAPAVLGCPAADDDHGRAGELGLGDGADTVGHAGPGGQDGQAGDPGELAGRLRGERRRLLVAHVEQPHRRALSFLLRLHRAVVHREHVRAGEGEHRLDAVRAGRRDRQLAAVAAELGRRVGSGLGGHDVSGSVAAGSGGWWCAARRPCTSSRSERTSGGRGPSASCRCSARR